MNKFKILLVNERTNQLNTISEIIKDRKQTWNIYRASDGDTAIKTAEKILPNLIIMVWELPLMSGIETTKKLKQNNITEDIPIIICSETMTNSEHLATAFATGAVDFVKFPIDFVELNARIQSILTISEKYSKIKNLNIEKNKLLSIIAHDLKNPIYTIKLLLDLILQKDLQSERKKEILKGISTTACSAFNLLENLMAWTKSQRNQIKFSPNTFSLIEVINEVYTLLSLNAENKAITLDTDIKNNLKVYADKNMISTIIRNLVANAIKFNPKNTQIKVKAKTEKDKIVISVSDNGIGISKENIERILNNKGNYSSVNLNNEIGSGIGLQVCKEFIKKHNSEFIIDSIENKGSTFKFSIPKAI